jgi:hypothetical protein
MAALAVFELDRLRERILSGIAAAAGTKGQPLVRQLGFSPKPGYTAPKVLPRVTEGRPFRQIARGLNLCKNTIMSIVWRSRTDGSSSMGDSYLTPGHTNVGLTPIGSVSP